MQLSQVRAHPVYSVSASTEPEYYLEAKHESVFIWKP
jgi:hypothetical protein